MRKFLFLLFLPMYCFGQLPAKRDTTKGTAHAIVPAIQFSVLDTLGYHFLYGTQPATGRVDVLYPGNYVRASFGSISLVNSKADSARLYGSVIPGLLPIKTIDTLASKNNPNNLNTSRATALYADSVTRPKWVAIGHSIITGYGSSSKDSTMEANLGRMANVFVYNLGISGQTSTQVLTRFQALGSLAQFPVIIQAQRNNYADSATVIHDDSTMVAILKSAHNNKYIVLGDVNAAGEPFGNSGFNIIEATNIRENKLFGPHFIDIKTEMLAYGNGSSGDSTDIINKVIPRSLRYDDVHLNDKGYRIEAGIIMSRMNLLFGGEITHLGQLQISGGSSTFTGIGLDLYTNSTSGHAYIDSYSSYYPGISKPLSIQYSGGDTYFNENGGSTYIPALTGSISETTDKIVSAQASNGKLVYNSTGQIATASGEFVITNGAHSTVGQNVDLALSVQNSSPGTYGDATHVGQFVSNSKGLITGNSNVSIAIPSSQVTNFNPSVLTAPLTGYISGAGTVSSSDNILQAVQKLNGNLNSQIYGTSNQISYFNGTNSVTGSPYWQWNPSTYKLLIDNPSTSGKGYTMQMTGTIVPTLNINPVGSYGSVSIKAGSAGGRVYAGSLSATDIDVESTLGAQGLLIQGTYATSGSITMGGWATSTANILIDAGNSNGATNSSPFTIKGSSGVLNGGNIYVYGGISSNYPTHTHGDTYIGGNTTNAYGHVFVPSLSTKGLVTNLATGQLGTTNGTGYVKLDGSGNVSYDNTIFNSGAGSTGYLPYYTGTNTQGNSLIYTNGALVGVNTGTTLESGYTFQVNGATALGTLGSARIYGGTLDATHAFLQSKDLSATQHFTFYATDFKFTAPVILQGYTVATLPTGTIGMTAYVTDALSPVALSPVVAGGTSVVPVFYNGTTWIVQ